VFRINYKIIILLNLLIFLILTNIIYSQENYEVTDVSVAGNKTIDTETILNAITLNSTGWFSNNILGDDPLLFSSSILSTDLLNITGLYQREGFIFVKVNSDQTINDENKTVDVLFTIDEGPPIVVDSINIKKIESFDKSPINLDSLVSVAYKSITLTKGKIFRDEDIRKDKSQIINLFLDNGYPHVAINYELGVDTINCSVLINWYINTGPFSIFGKTTISGLNFYPQSLITSKLKYFEGEIFNAEKLNETQTRLQDIGIFYGVNVNSKLNNDPIDVIPVHLNIVEAKRLKTILGVGYGTDEKFRISLELTYLGILKGPGRINFELKKSAIEKFSFKLGYNQPEFLWERTIFRLNTFAVKVDELPYEENSIGFNIGIFKNFSKIFSSSITYILENIELDVNSIALQSDSSQIQDEYNKSAINIILRNTNAEPYVSPERGFNLSLSATYSGIGIGSPYRFFRSIIEVTNYHTTFSSLIAGLKLSIGYLESFNTPEFVPVEERFYKGGSTSVRGWERFELGPKDLNGIPKGGNSFLEGSIELRYPSFEKIYGVLFLDFGNVWEPSLTYKINELQYAIGIGLRYATPIGPVRLDLATPIFNENKNKQFWFSIGHAF
jgi:outer membrane protein insertion porin family